MALGDNLKSPDAEWWLRRLRHAVHLLKTSKDLNKQGVFLIKFSVYSTFLDLTAVAMRENNQEVYAKAKALINEGLTYD